MSKRKTAPSTEKTRVWIWAEKSAKSAADSALSIEAGKWLIFRASDEIDDAWSIVRAACKSGRLDHAKVSTRHPIHGQYGNKHVICVYTDDSENRQDVFRIRKVLRDLGFTEPLNYKPDAMTLNNQRGSMWRD